MDQVDKNRDVNNIHGNSSRERKMPKDTGGHNEACSNGAFGGMRSLK